MRRDSGGFKHLLTRRLYLSKGQLVDVEGRLQTRQWDDDAGKRQWASQLAGERMVRW